jgi:uncharacterized protein YehS (DUF1456 family)
LLQGFFLNYGEEEIMRLAKHYSDFFEAEPATMVDTWRHEIKPIMQEHKKSKFSSPSAFMTYFLDNFGQHQDFCLLFQIAGVQPVSTVPCERAFSRQNLIKTKLRHALGVHHLEDLMRLSAAFRGIDVSEPEVEALIDKAMDRWFAAKPRRNGN